MTGEEIFDVWAPPRAIWSPWCKPVLFAHMTNEPPLPEVLASTEPSNFYGLPQSHERCAIVVDLPGAESVAIGLRLAEKLRYRPVPLFNAAPPPDGQPAEVDVAPILGALWHGTETLRKLALGLDVPPIFLLDSRRRRGGQYYESFDNRSLSFPTDFPSANRLRAQGIERALLIQATDEPEADLSHTLRRWQEARIAITRRNLASPGDARPVEIAMPSWFKSALYRLLELAGLHRNALGGFGGFPRDGSSGG